MAPRFAIAFLLAVTGATAPGRIGQAQSALIDTAAINLLMRAEVDSGFSGVVRIVRHDSTLLWRVYAPPGSTLTRTSAFWIASMTKGFTALATLMLVNQGRLTLLDSLGALLPDVPADKRGITIEQLLTHSAGLAGEESGLGIADRNAGLQAILSPPLAYPPGHGYRYGDDDYELLAGLIEIVTRQPWYRFVQREILDPVGLRETGFWCGAGAVPLPVPRVNGAMSRCASQDRGTSADDWGHRGANGMSSTVEDLLRWVKALDAGPGIPQALRRSMAEPRILVRREHGFDVFAGYGLRIYVKDGRVIERWHSGSSDDSHTAVVRVMADGVIVVVLSNGGWRGGTSWASYIAPLLYPRN